MSDMLDKVRKLLAKAEDPSTTPEESEALNTKASELIAKYGIEMAHLSAEDRTRDQVINKIIDVDPPYNLDKIVLLNSVAMPLRCKLIRLNKGSHARVRIFGFQSDVERVEILYTSLLVQMAGSLARATIPAGVHAKSFKTSYMAAYSSTVRHRLVLAEQRAKSESSEPGTDLVLFDRSKEVSRAFDEAYPKTVKSSRKLGFSGYAQGKADGEQANLGGTSLGSSTTSRTQIGG